MPTSTYTPIATTTVGTATASVTLSSISSTYTDLILVINGTTTSGADAYLRVNGDSGNNYSQTILVGQGTSAGSTRYSSNDRVYIDYNGLTAATFNMNAIFHFMNYSNTSVYKTFLVRENNAAVSTESHADLWRSTSAINSITAFTGSTWVSGTTFNLFGIKAA
jgi:hypothetical protein